MLFLDRVDSSVQPRVSPTLPPERMSYQPERAGLMPKRATMVKQFLADLETFNSLDAEASISLLEIMGYRFPVMAANNNQRAACGPQ